MRSSVFLMVKLTLRSLVSSVLFALPDEDIVSLLQGSVA